jgi:hypothetical protein
MSPVLKMRLVYSMTICFAVAVIVQMGLFLTGQLQNYGRYGCAATTVVFGLFTAYTLVRIVMRIAGQWRSTRKWMNTFRAHVHVRLTKQLNYKYRSWGTEIIVVRDDEFLALTIGMLRPRIVLSTGVLERFNDHEVKAILLHEWHHCRNRDNPKLFGSSLLVDAFGYLPITKSVHDYHKIWGELSADRFAIQQMGTGLHLGNVLLKLVQQGLVPQRPGVVHFTEAAVHYRIMQVLEPEQAVKVPVSLLRPFLVSCSFLILIMIGGSS